MNKTGGKSLHKWNLLLSDDEQDFYTCYNACYDDLYRLGLFLYKDTELVKECIHLLFIELWKIKPKLAEVSNLKEYVITIYKRILYKQRNGALKYRERISDIDITKTENREQTCSYEEILIASQEDDAVKERLLKALPMLGERQRELIRLRYFEERSIEEIATLTGLTTRTVYNTLHNALCKLKELLCTILILLLMH